MVVDKELKEYINDLLSKGYDLDSIKTVLVKAGHDMNKVEGLSVKVFELFHNDLITYMDNEIKKGRNVDEIKQELLNLGHSDKKLGQIIQYHKRKTPSILKRLSLSETFTKERVWFKGWLKIYIFLFLFVIISFIIVSFLLSPSRHHTETLEFDDRINICNSILENESGNDFGFYNKACNAILYDNPAICAELSYKNAEKCIDTFFIYKYYLEGKKELCKNITNGNLEQLCLQMADKNCEDYFGFPGFCTSMINDDISQCSTNVTVEEFPLLESCRDNYRIFSAIKKDQQYCDQIQDFNAKHLCKAIS